MRRFPSLLRSSPSPPGGGRGVGQRRRRDSLAYFRLVEGGRDGRPGRPDAGQSGAGPTGPATLGSRSGLPPARPLSGVPMSGPGPSPTRSSGPDPAGLRVLRRSSAASPRPPAGPAVSFPTPPAPPPGVYAGARGAASGRGPADVPSAPRSPLVDERAGGEIRPR